MWVFSGCGLPTCDTVMRHFYTSLVEMICHCLRTTELCWQSTAKKTPLLWGTTRNPVWRRLVVVVTLATGQTLEIHFFKTESCDSWYLPRFEDRLAHRTTFPRFEPSFNAFAAEKVFTILAHLWIPNYVRNTDGADKVVLHSLANLGVHW